MVGTVDIGLEIIEGITPFRFPYIIDTAVEKIRTDGIELSGMLMAIVGIQAVEGLCDSEQLASIAEEDGRVVLLLEV